MIGLGLRLALAAGREAAARLVIIAAAVAIGTALLLSTVAATNAVSRANVRYAWLNTTSATHVPSAAKDPLYFGIREDFYRSQSIARVDVAATGPNSPVIPGIPRPPGAGEYYLSPALRALMRGHPGDELADRYPGRDVGTIADVSLPAPTSLIVIVGHAADEGPTLPDAKQITVVNGTSPEVCDGCAVGVRAAGMDLLLSVVALALIFPVLMLIGTATRLAALRREQRFAAMRLVGAAPRQISAVAAVEAVVSAVAGTVVGFALFYALRDRIAGIPFTGEPFFPSDMALGPVAIVAVALGVPLAAAAVARVSLRRVNISPLGVTRRVTPRPPRAYRLVPLLAGLAELAYFVGRRPDTTAGQTRAYLAGMFVVMGGLVIAGPWLTMVGARLIAGRASRPAALIATRRLADDPKGGFRSVSGLILALFVTSVAIGVITTIDAERAGPSTGAGLTNLALDVPPDAGQVPDSVRARLGAIPGVRGTAVVRQAPDDLPPATGDPRFGPAGPTGPRGPTRLPGLVACADLVGHPDFGTCQPGAEVAAVESDLTNVVVAVGNRTPLAVPALPTAHIDAARLGGLPPIGLVVDTNGDASTVERARTVLAQAYPRSRFAYTRHDFAVSQTSLLRQWQQLADVVLLASLAIAGCSLAVSVVGGLNDRKRPFSMLRLTGVPLGVLRRVVSLETVVPLLAAAVVAVAVGFLAAHLFLKAQMGYSVHPPGSEYAVLVACGLAVSLGIIASTFPLLRRITGPETARNE